MKTVSTAYAEQMKKPMRNPGRIAVTIDLVSIEAMENAIYGGPTGTASQYSVTDHIYDKDRPTVTYAAYETGVFRADGSPRFVQDWETTQSVDGGFISGSVGRSGFTTSFANPSRVKGVTVIIGSDVTCRIYITLEDSSHTSIATFQSDTLHPNNPNYDDMDGYTWTHEWDDWVENVSYAKVEVQPSTTLSVARIKSVWFGIETDIAETKILKAVIDSHESPIMETLPQTDVSVEVINLNNEFTYDDTTSMVHSLEPRQPLTIKIGYTLDNGTVEWLDMGRYSISDWSVTRSQLTINATDIFRTMDATYYGGDPRGFTTTAESQLPVICGDYGIPCEVKWDGVPRIYMHYPPVSHAECLQLIAGASFSRLHQDPKSDKILLSKYDWYNPDPVLTLEANDIYDDAYTEKNERVREVRVVQTTYKMKKELEKTEIDGVTAAAGETLRFTFGEPGRVSAVLVDGRAFPAGDRGAYAVDVFFPTAVSGKTVTIERYGCDEAKAVYVENVNPSGSTIEWSNPLLYHPKNLALILAKYYGDGVLTYDFSYRGNPELECGDVINYTTETGRLAKMRIEDLTLEFNGAFRGHIRGRCL